MAAAIPRETNSYFRIRTATQVCRQRLQECASHKLLQERHWAENRAGEFNLWSSGVGACADEANSLDKRLEQDIPAQKVVIGALSTLAAWTTKCTDLARAEGFDAEPLNDDPRPAEVLPNDSITLGDAKKMVEALLATLVDLEIAIRRAGMASRLRRADRTFETRRNDYTELSENLKFILRVYEASRHEHISSQRHAETSSDRMDAGLAVARPSEILHENHRSSTDGTGPAGPSKINVNVVLRGLASNGELLRPEQQILVLANLKRADRFAFQKARQSRLGMSEVQRSSEPVPFYGSSANQPLQSRIRSGEQYRQPSILRSTKVAIRSPSEASTSTTDQVSDFKRNEPMEKAIKAKEPGVAATTIALRASYPKPPRDKVRCPYCFVPFEGEVDDAHQWK